MKPFRWNPKKGDILKVERGISFEAIVVAIESGGLLDILAHSNAAKYPRQQIFAVSYEGYVYLVPYVEEDTYIFLKTIIPSRKATRDYLKRDKSDAQD